MWALENQTPFEAERTWVRDRDGVHHWIVVVKATYDIGPDGGLRLADEPVAPLFTPEYHGADGESSLRYEADLVAMKPATDVYLNALAHAPGGKPATQVRVAFSLGPMRKVLDVYGDRMWLPSVAGAVKATSPEPFLTAPITYERAYGGFDREDPDPARQRMDARNPVGTGVVAHGDHLIGKPVPAVEDPAQLMGRGDPAGFGAIASHWSPRRELAGTYDAKWAEERKPLLPLDYDPRFLLCAPADQQVPGYLKGGEAAELINLTPGGWLRFALPAESFRFESRFGSTRREHGGELVSVVIEPEGPRLVLVWQTSLRCGRDAEYLDQTVIRRGDQP